MGAIVSDEGSEPEEISRIAQTTAAVTKLKVIWNDKNIAISSMAMSMFLHARETWTITWTILQRTVQGGRRKGRGSDVKTTPKSGLAWNGISYYYHTTESQEPRGVEEAGCRIYSGAPTVNQTTG